MIFYRKIRNRYNESPVLKRIANGAFWSLTGIALAKFLVLVAGILCDDSAVSVPSVAV